ncbi:hypothetical protein Bca4012_070359 [Brassica carinata]
MSTFIYFLFPLAIFVVSFFIISKKHKPSKWKLPPGPKTLPIIGNLHNIKGQPHTCFINLSKTYGPVMLLRFGFVPVVVISSREGAEEALKTQDLECCSRPETVAARMISYNFKDIGFAPYGEEWKVLRKLVVVELLNMKKFQSFGYIREEENNLLVKKLTEAALTRSPVNLKKTLFTLVASIICRLAFGIDIHKCEFVDEDNAADLVHKFELLVDGIAFSDFFPGVGWILDRVSGQNKTLNNVFSELDTFFQKILDAHLKPVRTVSNNPDVVDVMVGLMKKQEQDGDSFKLTTDHFKGIISDIFLAGVNTSAITMIWTMTELIRNPNIMKKVQHEIRTTLGDKKERLTADDLNHLHYLKHVIKETFRLHPAAPLLLPRETMSDIKIQGFDIPKKSQMMINVYSIARDPKIWSNPDEFNPDRFIESSVDYKGLNFELLPFGSGRRICPGMNMGIATVELGLLNLLYFFDWAVSEGKTIKDMDVEETGSLIISKKSTLELAHRSTLLFGAGGARARRRRDSPLQLRVTAVSPSIFIVCVFACCLAPVSLCAFSVTTHLARRLIVISSARICVAVSPLKAWVRARSVQSVSKLTGSVRLFVTMATPSLIRAKSLPPPSDLSLTSPTLVSRRRASPTGIFRRRDRPITTATTTPCALRLCFSPVLILKPGSPSVTPSQPP